jgi:hypothetical protein
MHHKFHEDNKEGEMTDRLWVRLLLGLAIITSILIISCGYISYKWVSRLIDAGYTQTTIPGHCGVVWVKS